MRKLFKLLLILPLLSGCYARNGGIPLYNSYGYNYTPQSVVVQKGDTLYSLSKKYQIPLRSFIEENNISAPYELNVGQNLKMPKRKSHKVVKGDTLYSISKKYNVDLASLSKMNELHAPYSISVGQDLLIPQNIADNQIKTVHASSTKNTPVRHKNIKKTSKKVSSVKTAHKPQPKKYANTQKRSRKPVSTYRKSKFIWPVNGTVVSNFGTVGKGRRNDGINIKAAIGTNVKAADKGVVAYAGNELKGFGNLILIKHSDGYITAYAHNHRIYVKKGQRVLRGEKIATVGKTGSVRAPQLHFEVRAGKKAVNPKSYLPRI